MGGGGGEGGRSWKEACVRCAPQFDTSYIRVEMERHYNFSYSSCSLKLLIKQESSSLSSPFPCNSIYAELQDWRGVTFQTICIQCTVHIARFFKETVRRFLNRLKVLSCQCVPVCTVWDHASNERCVPRTMRSQNDVSLGRCDPDRCVPTLDRAAHGSHKAGSTAAIRLPIGYLLN